MWAEGEEIYRPLYDQTIQAWSKSDLFGDRGPGKDLKVSINDITLHCLRLGGLLKLSVHCLQKLEALSLDTCI